MITKENGYPFDYDTVDPVLDDLLKLEGIDEFEVSEEAMEKTIQLLGLNDSMTQEDVTAIRNAFVRRCSEMIEALREEGTEESRDRAFDLSAIYLSGITGVIDHWKWLHRMPV